MIIDYDIGFSGTSCGGSCWSGMHIQKKDDELTCIGNIYENLELLK